MRHPIPARFTVGAKAVRTFGPNSNGRKDVTIAKVTKTILTDSEGNRYYADAASNDNGTLFAYGAAGLWVPQLRLDEGN